MLLPKRDQRQECMCMNVPPPLHSREKADTRPSWLVAIAKNIKEEIHLHKQLRWHQTAGVWLFLFLPFLVAVPTSKEQNSEGELELSFVSFTLLASIHIPWFSQKAARVRQVSSTYCLCLTKEPVDLAN